MIKTLWFFVKIAVLIYCAVWLVGQEGRIAFGFLGYDIETQTGLFFLGIIALFSLLFLVLRMVQMILHSPKALSVYQDKRKEKIGYGKITQGLAAIAAGDADQASDSTKAAQKYFKENDNSLLLLLQAQTARLRGEEALAQTHFETMLKDKNAMFLGLRGLIKSSINVDDHEKALNYAHKALKKHPSQAWILELVYDLEIKNRHWVEALKLGKKLEKNNIVDAGKLLSDRIAIHLMRYDYDKVTTSPAKAAYNLKLAYKIDPAFVPTITRYAEFYQEQGKPKKAIALISEAWKVSPHPELAVLWQDLYKSKSKEDTTKKLAHAQKLIEFKPNAVESYVAVAHCAIDLGYWGEAKAHLMSAEKIALTHEIIELKYLVEKNITHSEDSNWLQNDADTVPAKRWVCMRTGRVYNHWSAIVMPQDCFNTMKWDYPIAQAMNIEKPNLLSKSPRMLIDPV